MSGLPPPVTRTDELLVAVHDLLGEILERLPPRQDPQSPAGVGSVEIQEPARAAAKKTSAKKTAARRRS